MSQYFLCIVTRTKIYPHVIKIRIALYERPHIIHTCTKGSLGRAFTRSEIFCGIKYKAIYVIHCVLVLKVHRLR